jgi:hypothetical protein
LLQIFDVSVRWCFISFVVFVLLYCLYCGLRTSRKLVSQLQIIGIQQAGQLLWETSDGTQRYEEIVYPVCALEHKTSNDVWSASNMVGPRPLFRYAELADICVLVQIDDSVPSNKRVFKTIESSSPDNLLPIRVRCNSHQACLVVIPFTVWCNFLNPLFCNTKHLHISSNFEKALKSLREVLARRAKRITGRMPPRACAGDWALLLEVLYYSVDLVEVSGDASAEYLDAIRESDKTRRAFGATVVGMFTGDPSDLVGDVVHHCSGVSCGFCGGTDETFHVKAFEISKELFFPHNQVPSMTKWKKLLPVVQTKARGHFMHGIGIDTWRRMRGGDDNGGDDLDASSDDFDIADVLHSDAPEHRESRRKRTMSFNTNASMATTLYIYCAIANFVHHVHHFMFKHSKLEDPSTLDAVPPIVRLCGSNSVPMLVMQRLFRLVSPESLHWAPLRARFGGVVPSDTMTFITNAVLMVIANLWRRFVYYFQRWPWKLCCLVDSNATEELVNSTILEFLTFAGTPCCVSVFCRKLLGLFPTLSAFKEPWAHRFFVALFKLLLPSTDHIENIFAHIKQWLNRLGRPPLVSTMSANHFNREWRRVWTSRLPRMTAAAKKLRSKRQRPVWAKPLKARFTSMNVFLSRKMKRNGVESTSASMIASNLAWRAVDKRRKANYAAIARDQRAKALRDDPLKHYVSERKATAVARTLGNYSVGSTRCAPWNAGCPEAAISLETLHRARQTKSFIKNSSASWCRAYGGLYAANAAYRCAVADSVKTRPCLDTYPSCNKDAADLELNSLRDSICELCQIIVTSKTVVGENANRCRLFRFTCGEQTRFVMCTSFLLMPSFTAEFMRCTLQGDLIRINVDEGDSVPEMLTEMEFAVSLANVASGPWEVREYQYTRSTSSTSSHQVQFQTQGHADIDIDELITQRNRVHRQEAALALLRRSSSAVKRRQPAAVRPAGKKRKAVVVKKLDFDAAETLDSDHDSGDAGSDDISDGDHIVGVPIADRAAWKDAAEASDAADKRLAIVEALAKAARDTGFPNLTWSERGYVLDLEGRPVGRITEVGKRKDIYMSCQIRGHSHGKALWLSVKKLPNAKRMGLQWLSEGIEHDATTEEHNARWKLLERSELESDIRASS